MKIPVYIIAFNNPTYVKMMVEQLKNLKVEEIIVVDNCSTYEPLLQYYKDHQNDFKLMLMDQNYGHEVVTKCFYQFLPDVFAITDPDLKFHPKLPETFLTQLYNLTEQYSAYKVGMALDISDHQLFNPKMSFFGQTIKDWESRFWTQKIDDEKYQLYNADIDTTFAVYNKKFQGPKNIRVAGDFVAKHLPWYQDEKIPQEEHQFYLKHKTVGSWVNQDVYETKNEIKFTKPIVDIKYLIISPQAGFGNRIRALAAGILLARQTGRIPLHAWEPEINGASNISHVKDIKSLGFNNYFLGNRLALANTDNIPKIDLVLSEWGPGDYWYQFQNTAQKKWNVDSFLKVNINLDQLTDFNQIEYILLETSLTTRLSPELGGCKDDMEFEKEISKIYQEYFIPQDKYLKLLKDVPDIDIGFSIRRGEFLQYFPEANQDPETIIRWAINTIKIFSPKNMVIFSDDHNFRDEFKNKLKLISSVNFINGPDNLLPWELGFVEFLILAKKCQRIYGTPKSSFAEEAHLFGGKFHYQKILTPLPEVKEEIKEHIKLDMSKEVLPAITIAILCKNKAHLLNLYLRCIHSLYYPKQLINLYIRTNDNRDRSAEILKSWISKVKNEYREIYFDDSSVDQSLKKYGDHEWNAHRFSVLGKIRQDSINYAIQKSTDYFVIDCDNFVKPQTLLEMVRSRKSAIAPFLKLICVGSVMSMYSNYHYTTDENGYYKETAGYNDIWAQVKPDIHPVEVIHCTYYLKNEILSKVSYSDQSQRHEYVIFSHNLRKANVQQYIDNRLLYGYLTFEDTEAEFNKKFSFEICKELLLQ